jgi:hypothetical protein
LLLNLNAMIWIKINTLLFCSFIFLNGCNTKQAKQTDTTEFSIQPDARETIPLSSIVNDYELVVLETTERSLLGEIKKTQVYNDLFFILSQNEIFVFEPSGKLKQKINNIGRGPGEYAGISDFDIYSDILYILDRSNQNILEYDLNGNVLKTRSLNMWAQKLIVLNETEILLYSGEEDNSFNQCKLSKLLSNGDIIGFMPIDSRKSKFLQVSSTQNFVRCDSVIYFHEAFNDTIFVINDEQINAKYSLHYEAASIPRSFFDNNYEDIYNFFKDFNETQYVNGTYNLFLIKDKIYYTAYRNKGPHLFSINKSSGGAKTSDYILDDLVLGNAPISVENLNISFSNGRLLYFIYPYTLPEDSSQITNSALKNMVNSISDESNPVIAMFKTQE